MMPSTTKSPQPRRQGAQAAKSGGAGAPQGYAELRKFLPERRQRRLALGVTENTILAWDERRASRVHRRHQERVKVLLWACVNLRAFLPSDPAVGEFLHSKQLILGNRQPYGFIRLHGQRGAAAVVKIAGAAARRAAADQAKLELGAIVENEALWKAMGDGLSDVALGRLGSAIEAAQGIGASTGSRDMLR